jgi:hypothetical protein
MRLSYHIVVLLLILCPLGCGNSGPQKSALSGTVSYDGTPVADGRITFVPTGEQGTSAGDVIKDGKYSIAADKGPTFGKYKVQINWSKKTGNQIEVGSPAPPGTKIDEVKEAIPVKYNAQTTLEKDVNSAKQVIDFPLEK